MPSFLTLDQSTLFYWTLSDSYLDKKRKHSSAINDWASAIPSNAKPASRALSHVTATTSSYPKSIVPSLTSGSSRSSAPSVLTNNVRVVSHGALDSAKVKAEPVPDITIFSDGGLSDADEIKGEEREAAIKSPPKGKKRVTNEVSFFCCYIIIT
jgi:hypothetical protein